MSSSAVARIHQLPEDLANQIAAGEVIERPAAVVKELVENSLDAGATRIRIRTEDGGRALIQIDDDGSGIVAEDLALALARHATSKLASSEDLFRIHTLGFRGEALPSIAAVSELAIASRPQHQAAGRRLMLRGGTVVQDEPCALAGGTSVVVRNLFWNVPARLKFLKSEASETGHITEQVIRLALAHPAVGFTLGVGERTVLELPPVQTLAVRLRALFGGPFCDSLLALAAHAEGMQVAGFVAHPREAKPTARRQYCFLNGRFVKDRLLLAALREGFKGYLEPRLNGAAVLHLDCDPALVDVNVHPTKSEVRFRREGEVFALVQRAVASTLAEHAGGFSLLTDADRARVAATPSPLPARETTRGPILSIRTVREPPAGVQERFLPALPAVDGPAAPLSPPAAAVAAATTDRPAHAPAPSAPVGPAAPSAPSASAPSATTAAPITPGLPPGVRRVLQLHRMFLLIETDQGLRLVDQHALHEKALFLALEDPAWTGGSQQLLVPRTVPLTATEVAAVAPLLPELIAVGIEAEVFGPTTVLVRAAPPRLKRLNWVGFFASLAQGGTAAAVAAIGERIRHSAACHGAVKAGQELGAEEQLELVAALYRLEGMEHCPHGRPTTLDLSWAELARRFQRS